MHSRGITGRKSLPLPSGFAFSRHAITFIPRLSSAACNFSAKLSFPNSATQAGSGSSLGSGSACSCGSPLSGYHRVICPCALVRNFHLLTTKQNQKHAPGFRATSNDCVSTMYIYIYQQRDSTSINHTLLCSYPYLDGLPCPGSPRLGTDSCWLADVVSSVPAAAELLVQTRAPSSMLVYSSLGPSPARAFYKTILYTSPLRLKPPTLSVSHGI